MLADPSLQPMHIAIASAILADIVAANLSQVPILVRGRLVSWIDSKAMFGDERTHG